MESQNQYVSPLQGMFDDFFGKPQQKTKIQLGDIGVFISGASMDECRYIIGELIHRVSDEVGCASALEDAFYALREDVK